MINKGHEIKKTASAPDLMSMRDLAVMLIERNDIHEGLYDIKIEFKIGTGGIGQNPEELLPGLLIGISKIGIVPSIHPNESTIDASSVNPYVKARSGK